MTNNNYTVLYFSNSSSFLEKTVSICVLPTSPRYSERKKAPWLTFSWLWRHSWTSTWKHVELPVCHSDVCFWIAIFSKRTHEMYDDERRFFEKKDCFLTPLIWRHKLLTLKFISFINVKSNSVQDVLSGMILDTIWMSYLKDKSLLLLDWQNM